MKKEITKIVLIIVSGIIAFSGAFGQIQSEKPGVSTENKFLNNVNKIQVIDKIGNREVTLDIVDKDGEKHEFFKSKKETGQENDMSMSVTPPLKKLTFSAIRFVGEGDLGEPPMLKFEVALAENDDRATILEKVQNALDRGAKAIKPRKPYVVKVEFVDDALLFNIYRPVCEQGL